MLWVPKFSLLYAWSLLTLHVVVLILSEAKICDTVVMVAGDVKQFISVMFSFFSYKNYCFKTNIIYTTTRVTLAH